MDFDDSVLLPTQVDDDSFLLAARPIYAPVGPVAEAENQFGERESKRGNSQRKLENGRRRTEDLVAKLRRDREERKKRDARDHSTPSLSSAMYRGNDLVKSTTGGSNPEQAEWEDIREPETELESGLGQKKQQDRQRTRSPEASPSGREDHVAELKARLAESRLRRDNSFGAKGNESAGQTEEVEPTSTLRNSALAKIMSRGDRAVRSTGDRSDARSNPSTSRSQVPTTSEISKTSLTSVGAAENGMSKGDRLIEKLLRSAPVGERKGANEEDSRALTVEQVHSQTVVKSTPKQIIMTGLERIDEQTLEGQDSVSVSCAQLPREKTGRQCAVGSLELVATATDMPDSREITAVVIPTPAAKDIASSSAADVQSKSDPVISVEPDIGHELHAVGREASVQSEESSPVASTEPIMSMEESPISPASPSPKKHQDEQWVDVESEQPIIIDKVAVPALVLNQAMFPTSSIDARMAELLMPIQAQAGPSTTRASVIAPSFTQSRRLRTTCPRTPVFARSKRSVTRESPVKRVTQARPAERLISTRTSAPNRQERCINKRPRIALDDLPTIGSNRSNANKIVAPTVQGITRKPSAIVKIPNFEKAHRAAEVKVKRTPPRVTRPDCGKTPGRTSRARMIERAEFDKANREYQQRREDALKRFKQEKEDAAWAAELELRKAIAFKANPVPEFIRASKPTS